MKEEQSHKAKYKLNGTESQLTASLHVSFSGESKDRLIGGFFGSRKSQLEQHSAMSCVDLAGGYVISLKFDEMTQ